MEITNTENGQMWSAINAALAVRSQLPFKLLYAISKPLDAVKKHYQDYEFARIELCNRMADKNEDGTPKTHKKTFQGQDILGEDGEPIMEFVFTDNKAEFEAQLKELGEQKIEIPEYRISVNDLNGSIDPSQIPHFHIIMKYFVKE